MSVLLRFCGAARSVPGSCFCSKCRRDAFWFIGDSKLAEPHPTEAVDESKAITRLTGFRMIIAAGRMCEAGRIRHYLEKWLWNSSATVLLVGFQTQGTLGWFDGARSVRIQREHIKVVARVRTLDDYSGHTDGPKLARWIAARPPIHRGVLLVHGEESALSVLSGRVGERTVPPAQIFLPLLDESMTSRRRPLDVRLGVALHPKQSLPSTGTMRCQSSSSTSTIGAMRQPTIARAALSFAA